MLGRVEFAHGAHGIVTDISIRSGQIEFTVQVERPHPRFNVHLWKLYGEDDTLIAMIPETEPREEWVGALPVNGGRTTVTLPIAIAQPWDTPDAIGPARSHQ